MSEAQQHINDLVKSNDVVLFMKGSPTFPQCRFSSSAVQILKACGLGIQTMRTVNVLDDDVMRQGIKEYSNWPAIPVLYIKGELIGGSDIMMELYRSGELKQLLHNSVGSPSRALQVGAALVGMVKVALEGAQFRDDKRLNITIDAATFTNELAAFCLASVKAATQLHGTTDELLSGFESQITKEFSAAVNGIYLQKSPRYIDADGEQDRDVINPRTPGDLLAVAFTDDPISQLMVGHVLNSHWTGQTLGTVSFLKKTSFFQG